MGRTRNVVKQFLKLLVVASCTAGFLFQTLEFLHLYWTYPTVVDIQVSIPSEIELPGITICNANGILPNVMCKHGVICAKAIMLNKYTNLCKAYPILCNENGTVESDFEAVGFYRYMLSKGMSSELLELIRKPLKEFFRCKIVSNGRQRDCNMDSVIYGSYYSESYLPSFCFTMNTLWSQPNNKIEKIKKSERIQFQLYIDLSDRNKEAPMDMPQNPKYYYPSLPTVQLAVHSPYTSPSPYLVGKTFFGGKRYEVKVKQDEKHLLPAPYQTNCTDYMPNWYSKGGVGPLNQLMAIEECKLNASLENLGCVPMSIDYPHNGPICKICDGTCNNTFGIWDHCTDLLQEYKQPCFDISYNMETEEKFVYIEKLYTSSLIQITERMYIQSMGYNCSTMDQQKTKRCQIIDIEFVFDNFEITNITYNPKFESLELFSVIGGYMGMYLGVSIVAMYDFAELFLIAVYKFVKKRNAKKKKKSLLVKPFNNGLLDRYDNIRDFRRRTAVHSYQDRY